MSTEKEFRAWDTDGEKWITESGYIQIAGNGSCMVFDENEGIWLVKNLIVVQYTGEKDEEGVKIYEGDRVDCWEDSPVPEAGSYGSSLSGIIEFEGAQFILRTKNGMINTMWHLAPHVKVVGNIYENK